MRVTESLSYIPHQRINLSKRYTGHVMTEIPSFILYELTHNPLSCSNFIYNKNMKSGFDINKLTGDGYLILPLSMSKLAHEHGQDPNQVYDTLEYFSHKLETLSNDVVFLYTYGLYFNTDAVAFEERKKLNQQILNHSRALRNLIEKRKKFMPAAFHYMSFDHVILNSPQFGEFFDLLKKTEKEDEMFRKELQKDMLGREYNEANLNFILEEITVSHILTQHLVDLPRTLVRRDIWRLIAYPGPCINALRYQWKNKILPQKDLVNPYSGGQYDLNKKIFDTFS